MTLTKADIIKAVRAKNGSSLKESTAIVETLRETIKSTLASGDDVMVSGFGKFCVKKKGERKGRNSSTGDELILVPRKVVTFKCSGKLRDKINGG